MGQSEKLRSANSVFPLTLWKTYYNQGFFNVPREFDHFVGDEGPVTLMLCGDGRVSSYINRSANLNGTARVMGRVALRDWFQSTYSEGDTIPVRFETPRRLILG